MPSLDEIRRALAAHRTLEIPTRGRRQAAVALVLRENGGAPELLFIERAEREGDPWSGHMAFPGGRLDPGDTHAREAAERETLEEVGIRLDVAEALGKLDDLEGHRAAASGGLVISAFVYRVEDRVPLVPNHEVREAFWVPVDDLLDSGRHVEHPLRIGVGARNPGILVGEPERHIVWGLTYRFLELFFDIVGRPLPNRW